MSTNTPRTFDLHALKSEADAIQSAAKAAGSPVKRAAALETVAQRHGFRDWNAASAAASSAPTADTSAAPPRDYRWLQLPAGHTFSSYELRDDFAKFVAEILNAGGRTWEAHPYDPEELSPARGGWRWSVDRNNDWWVNFSEDDQSLVRIYQRYGVQHALDSLCQWICYRWRMTVVAEPGFS